jgi:pimeloyl-ACP methyl ester carboxylesterase
VLQGGLGETSPWRSRIIPAVARTTRVCAYDRAGQGWSGDAPRPEDGLQVAKDLHTLLGRAGERGPYVLVGHSTGGTYAMTYAARYPREVAGMVLLDFASPDQFTVLPDYAGFYSIFSRVSALLSSLGRLGSGRCSAPPPGSTLPEPAASEARAFATSPRDLRSRGGGRAGRPGGMEPALRPRVRGGGTTGVGDCPVQNTGDPRLPGPGP